MRRPLRAVAILLVVLAGCSDARSTVAEALGIADKPAPKPITVDVLCDPSAGSTCAQAELRDVLSGCLTSAAVRPGSIVRLWMQGADVTTTRMVGQVASIDTKRTGKRARRHFEQRWIGESTQSLIGSAKELLQKRQRRSPIAESITRIALDVPSPAHPRVIIVIGDSLEVSTLGDFECGSLPGTKRFLRDLHRHDVLTADLLHGISVDFCFVDLKPVDHNRCAMTLERAFAVRQLWEAAIRSAGAATFTIDSGRPHSTESNPEN